VPNITSKMGDTPHEITTIILCIQRHDTGERVRRRAAGKLAHTCCGAPRVLCGFGKADIHTTADLFEAKSWKV